MKKQITTAVLAAALILSGGGVAHASDTGGGEPLDVVEEYTGPTQVTEWQNAPAPEPTVRGPQTTPGDATVQCIVCGVPKQVTQKVSGPTLVSKKFVRYLTGAWAQSTGYSWSSSTTVGATIDGGIGVSASSASASLGVSASVTKTYGITVNIAASKTRFSKLGLASNFNRYYVRSAVQYNDSAGKPKPIPSSSWKYGYLNSPTRDQYLIVYYQ